MHADKPQPKGIISIKLTHQIKIRYKEICKLYVFFGRIKLQHFFLNKNNF